MENPILQYKRGVYIYIGIWVALVLLDTGFLLYLNEFKAYVSITESLVLDSLLAVMGLIIWFPVYYTDLEKQGFLSTLFYHGVSGFVIIILWLGACNFILISAFSNVEGFSEYLKQTFIWRAIAGFFVYTVMALIYYLLIYFRNYRDQQIRESELKN